MKYAIRVKITHEFRESKRESSVFGKERVMQSWPLKRILGDRAQGKEIF